VLPERQFIERLGRMAGKSRNREIIRGIGDDCAIVQVPSGQQLLVTTDLCIEDVHFRREWHPAESVGHRCLARGISDIAAMGGEPMACFLSLGLPARLPQSWADRFLRGLLRLARRFRVTLAGGDTSSAPKIIADIQVLGTVPAGRALLRSGARPGDRIYVTGELGGAAATLKRLYSGEKIAGDRRRFYPVPRIEVARRLREGKLASSAIDISDGLSVDLGHLCKESGISALVEAQAIPVANAASLDLALHGGDDYELLFTAPENKKIPARIAGVSITMIGEVVKKSRRPEVRVRYPLGRTKLLPAKGWEHFVKI
jgi:thiamine-monophosphate kinase